MPNPAASTFRDSFATSGISGCWIVNAPDSGPALAGMTGDGSTGLLFHAGEGHRGNLQTQDRYVLTDDAMTIHLSGLALWTPPAPIGVTPITSITFSIAQPGYLASFELTFGWIVGQPAPYGTLGYSDNTYPSGTVQAEWAGETWFRFRCVSDGPFSTLYWETSPDGAIWTTRLSTTSIPTLNNLRASLVAYDLHADLLWWTWNGGGTPNCPTVPYVPAAGHPRTWAYLLA